jgi:hypothetical protein
MALMTREDKALYDLLKQYDEDGVLIDEEQFSESKDKVTPVRLVLAGLTARTSVGALLGYKSLEDRQKEIEEANKAAMEERAHPDPSFNAPGMDNLYTALKKENNIEKYPDFPSENEFKQMKLDEKIQLVEGLIEGSTDLSIRGYAYDAAASIVGAEQYGTKAERENSLYDAAKALDPMLEEYQERNPEEAKIFQYQNRDVMDKLYGNAYNAIKAGSDGTRELPSRSVFYAMQPEERISLVSEIIPEHPTDFLSGPFADNSQLIENIKENLEAVDQEFAKLATIDQWAEQDKLYGKIYTDLQAHSANSEDLPSRGEFFKMTTDEKKELVETITPKESILDLNGGFTPKEDEKNKIIELIEAISPRDTSPERSVNYADPIETIIEPEIIPTKPSMPAQQDNGAPNIQEPAARHKRKNLPPENYAYIDVEGGEKIALEHVRTKEGIEFHYPEDPKDNIITEKGNEKEGYKFESTQEAIDRGENITIETPCLDENAIIPKKCEKRIFNPKTNEMLLHKVPAGHQSRLDQDWLSKFEDKTPKSQSIVRTGVSEEDLEAIQQETKTTPGQLIANNTETEISQAPDSKVIFEQEMETPLIHQTPPPTPDQIEVRNIASALRNTGARIPSAPPYDLPSAPLPFTVRCPGENGKDVELNRNKEGDFVDNSNNVVVKMSKNGKDITILGQGDVFIDRPRTNAQFVTREKYYNGDFKQRIDSL